MQAGVGVFAVWGRRGAPVGAGEGGGLGRGGGHVQSRERKWVRLLPRSGYVEVQYEGHGSAAHAAWSAKHASAGQV